MAGSYRHCIASDGRLLDNERLVGMLENGGDVCEAVEEMYGMIWYLAAGLSMQTGVPPKDLIEKARSAYKVGIELYSPGVVEEGEVLPGWGDDDDDGEG